ncbi:hypothetical protein L9F63_011091, partial [Diploptera punctata]
EHIYIFVLVTVTHDDKIEKNKSRFIGIKIRKIYKPSHYCFSDPGISGTETEKTEPQVDKEKVTTPHEASKTFIKVPIPFISGFLGGQGTYHSNSVNMKMNKTF